MGEEYIEWHMDEDKNPTPTDVLIKAMEDAENMEEVLVIYCAKDGTINFKSNTDRVAVRIGMIAIVKEHLMHGTWDDESDYEDNDDA